MCYTETQGESNEGGISPSGSYGSQLEPSAWDCPL